MIIRRKDAKAQRKNQLVKNLCVFAAKTSYSEVSYPNNMARWVYTGVQPLVSMK